MSDAEKRTAQQRAGAIAASAVALVAGGQFIAKRFDVQKTAEAYHADAVKLAETLAKPSLAASGAAPEAGVKLVSFNNRISAADLGLRTSEPKIVPASFAYADLNKAPERTRDQRTLESLAGYLPQNFKSVEEDQAQLDCLAEAVYYEARSEGVKGQMAVAEVVMNRVRDSRFPKTVCGVVYQGRYRDTGCQFTFTCDGSLGRKPSGDAWDRARIIALHVSLGLNKPVTNNATHYHTDEVTPYWEAGMVETAVVGRHEFYRFPKSGPEWTQARLKLDAQRPATDADAVEAPAAELFTVAAKAGDAPAVSAEQPVAAALVPAVAEKGEEVAAVAPAIAAPALARVLGSAL